MPLRRDSILVGINGRDPQLCARRVINCGGVHAPEVARLIAELPGDCIPRVFYSKGSYFGLRGRPPFKRLIYPLPEPGGLGIHLTLDLAGRARFGPDVHWLDHPDYDVDASRAVHFYRAIRRYWPGLPDESLQPAYAGLRARISGPGEPAADFRIEAAAAVGVPGIINLFGIESPGLTASLAIARHVADLADTSPGESA